MPLQRFVKVKGKPGIPAANPWALGNNPPRYAGKQRDAALDGEPEFLDKYRDVEEVMLSHADLIASCKAGDLELIDQCLAMNHDEASAKMAPKAKKEKA